MKCSSRWVSRVPRLDTIRKRSSIRLLCEEISTIVNFLAGTYLHRVTAVLSVTCHPQSIPKSAVVPENTCITMRNS